VKTPKEQIVDTLISYDWDYFITLTFKRKVGDGDIQRMMDRFTNHYLIEGWVWCREWTTLGYPHLHLLLSINELKKVDRLKTILGEMGDVLWEEFNKFKGGVGYTLKSYGTQNYLWDMKQPQQPIHQTLKIKYYETIRRNVRE
jgi:hypothetical protein